MPLNKPGYRRALIVGTSSCCSPGPPGPPRSLAEDAGLIAQSADYFPDQIGNEWHYRGQLSEGPLQTIELNVFLQRVLGHRARKPSRA